jgi:cobalamin synthase
VNGRRDRGVADPHFTQPKQVDPASQRLHAEGHGGDAGLFVHGRVERDIGRRHIEGEVEHLETQPERRANLVDRRPARGEVLQHLPRNGLGIGGHPLGDNAVIGREDTDQRAIDRGLRRGLPRRQPFDNAFEPAEAAQRLGEFSVAPAHLDDGLVIRTRELRQQGANIVEREAGQAGNHGVSCCPMGFTLSTFALWAAAGHGKPMPPRIDDRPGTARVPFHVMLAQAVRFLSRIPVPRLPGEVDPHQPPDLASGAGVLPLAGVVIGAVGGVTMALAVGVLHLPALAAAALAVGSLVLVTGALHEDGLADTADGLGGGASPSRRLAIMSDSRVGAFGATAIGLSLILRVSLLAGLAGGMGTSVGFVVVAAAAVSRVGALAPLWMLPAAKTEGRSAAAAPAMASWRWRSAARWPSRWRCSDGGSGSRMFWRPAGRPSSPCCRSRPWRGG